MTRPPWTPTAGVVLALRVNGDHVYTDHDGDVSITYGLVPSFEATPLDPPAFWLRRVEEHAALHGAARTSDWAFVEAYGPDGIRPLPAWVASGTVRL